MPFGTSEEEVLKELTQLEHEGIICGYHTLINWEKTSIEKVTALIFSIASARKKLKMIREQHNQDFSDQELKAMYIAVLCARDEAREFLSEAPLSDPGHDDAVSVQRLCNRLLKKFPDSIRMDSSER